MEIEIEIEIERYGKLGREIERERGRDRQIDREIDRKIERERQRERLRASTTFLAIHASQQLTSPTGFPIFETSATALCGTTSRGKSLRWYV